MPSLPNNNKNGGAASSYPKNEIMEVFTYLVRKANMTYKDILELPHSQYLATLKHNYIFDMEQTEEGREYLNKARRFANPRKHADLSAIRNFGGYNSIPKGGEK